MLHGFDVQKYQVNSVSNILAEDKLQELEGGIEYGSEIYIYPPEYFCPKNYFTGEMHITENTRSIHHYAATWVNESRPLSERLKKRINFIRAHFNI